MFDMLKGSEQSLTSYAVLSITKKMIHHNKIKSKIRMKKKVKEIQNNSILTTSKKEIHTSRSRNANENQLTTLSYDFIILRKNRHNSQTKYQTQIVVKTVTKTMKSKKMI